MHYHHLARMKFKSKCTMQFTIQEDDTRAVACFLSEFWGDCMKNYLTASTFPGILTVLISPKLGASTVEPVRINISTHYEIEGWWEMELCRSRLKIVSNIRWVGIGDSISSKYKRTLYPETRYIWYQRMNAKSYTRSPKAFLLRHYSSGNMPPLSDICRAHPV